MKLAKSRRSGDSYSMSILYFPNRPSRSALENFALLILFISGSIEKFFAVRKSVFSNKVFSKIAPSRSQSSNTASVRSVSMKSASFMEHTLNTGFLQGELIK